MNKALSKQRRVPRFAQKATDKNLLLEVNLKTTLE